MFSGARATSKPRQTLNIESSNAKMIVCESDITLKSLKSKGYQLQSVFLSDNKNEIINNILLYNRKIKATKEAY